MVECLSANTQCMVNVSIAKCICIRRKYSAYIEHILLAFLVNINLLRRMCSVRLQFVVVHAGGHSTLRIR